MMKALKAILSVLLEVKVMRRLLAANIRRLMMNKAFWQSVSCMVIIECLLCLFLLNQTSMSFDFLIFLSFQCIGVLTSIFFSLFLGCEYSDGTIRNKLIVGHQRNSIYLASLFTGIFAITILYFAGILAGYFMSIISYVPPQFSFSQIITAGFVGWFACISYISIFNFIGMLSSSKAKTALLCLLIAFSLIFVGALSYSILSFTQDAFSQFLFEFNPVGQSVITMRIGIDSPTKLIGYSFILSFFLMIIGLYFFNKKDLK